MNEVGRKSCTRAAPGQGRDGKVRKPIAVGDGDKEPHEIVNNGTNSMPVPRENDRCFWRRTNTKKTVRFRLPNSRRVPWAVLHNELKFQCLTLQKEDSVWRKPRTTSALQISV